MGRKLLYSSQVASIQGQLRQPEASARTPDSRLPMVSAGVLPHMGQEPLGLCDTEFHTAQTGHSLQLPSTTEQGTQGHSLRPLPREQGICLVLSLGLTYDCAQRFVAFAEAIEVEWA